MKLYMVTYHHTSGSLTDLVRCDHKPSEKEVLSVLDHIDKVEKGAGEYLEIEEYSEDTIATIGISSNKSSAAKTAAIRIQICGGAIFGDSENGRVSQGGWFTLNGVEFMSATPTSREHAAEINREMTMLRTALAAGLRMSHQGGANENRN